MTAGQMLQAAGEAFESARRMGSSEAEAMDLALRELASCRQRNRSPSARSQAVPISDAVRAVIDAVLASHGFTLADARKRSRTGYCARISRARDEAIYVARRVDRDLSYPALAVLFERDHTSILHGQQTFAKRLQDNDVLAARMRKLVEGLPSVAVVAEQVAGGVA